MSTQQVNEAQTPCIAPWLAEPYRLWSLYDMLRFYASVFAACYRDLTSMNGTLVLHLVDGDGPELVHSVPVLRDNLLESLDGMLPEAHRLPLSPALLRKIERLRSRVSDDAHLNIYQADTLLKELNGDFIEELTEHCFFTVSPQRRIFHERKNLFGLIVTTQFPEIEDDIAAAGRCFAYEEWTATVFHLMRAVERGLQELASQVGVQNAAAHNMAVLEDALTRETKRLEQIGRTRRSEEETANMRFYSDAATQFQNFRLAHRNYVDHASAKYDERDTLRVLGSVRDFLQVLAAHRQDHPVG